jgi:hypothetical protein
MMEKLGYTLAEVSAKGGGSRTTLYDAINRGLLRAVKRGRSTIVLDHDLREYLARLPAIKPKNKP